MFFQKEPVRTRVDPEDTPHVGGVGAGFHGAAQHQHVNGDPHPFAKQGVFGNGHQPAGFRLGFSLIGNFGDLAADEHRTLFLAAAVELLIAFAETALVDVEIIDLGVVAHFFLDQVAVFEGVHAADPGAVGVVIDVTAAHAVDQGHALGRVGEITGLVAHENLPPGGAGGIAQALKLQAGEDVGITAVTEGFHGGGVQQVVSRGQDNAAHLEGLLGGRHGVVDGLGLAYRHTGHALAAHPAVQAAGGFLPGGRLVHTRFHLIEAGRPGRLGIMSGLHPRQRYDVIGDGGPVAARGGPGFQAMGEFVQVRAREELHDGGGCLVPGRYRLDHGGRSDHRIAGGKHMRNGCLHGLGIDGNGMAGGQVQVGSLFRPGHVGPLADGRDYRIAVDDELGPLHGDRPATAAVIRRSQSGADAFESHYPAVRGQDAHRCRKGGEFNAFLPGAVNLFGIGRHLLLGAAVDHGDPFGTQSFGRAGRIDGHVAATHHGHLSARPLPVALAGLPKKGDGVDYATGGVLTGNVHRHGTVGADGQENGPVSLIGQVRKVEIRAQAHAGAGVDTMAQQVADLPVQNVRGQAVVGDAHAKHAAEGRQGLENGDLVALQAKVIGHGQPGGTGADHGHLFGAVGDVRDRQVLGADLIGGEAFQVTDGQRCVHLLASALGFTGMRTYPPQHAGQGQPLQDQLHGFPVFSLSDELHIPLDIDAGGAGGRAGGAVFFVDGKRDGHSLGECPVDRLAVGQSLVPFAGQGNRAHLGAFAAAGAHPRFDISRFAGDGHRVVADVAGHIGNFAVGQQLDIGILGHLHHLGGADAGRAVQGGKGFVELEHVAAHGRLAFHQVDGVTGVADIQGGLHAGDAATHDHDVGMDVHGPCFQHLVEIYAVDGTGGQGLGLAGGLIFIFGDPGYLLANRGHLEEVGVQPGALAGALKSFFVEPGRAGGHHHPVEAISPDVVFDHLLAGIGTHEFVIAGDDHVFQGAGKVGHLGHPDLVGDVDAAVADIKSDFDGHRCSPPTRNRLGLRDSGIVQFLNPPIPGTMLLRTAG